MNVNNLLVILPGRFMPAQPEADALRRFNLGA